jgi:AcrR family transcriptional regulator
MNSSKIRRATLMNNLEISRFNRVSFVKEKPLPKSGHYERDERVRRSKKAILAATYQLLSETGFCGVSVEAVSMRSGVAKTTIYRHWPSRSELLLDACSNIVSKQEVPDTGSLKGDVTTLAMSLAAWLQSARCATFWPSLVDAAQRDTELKGVYTRLHAEMTGAFRVVVERGQRKGELPRTRKSSEVLAAIIGPLFYRRWFSREALDERFVRGIVESALGRRRK